MPPNKPFCQPWPRETAHSRHVGSHQGNSQQISKELFQIPPFPESKAQLSTATVTCCLVTYSRLWPLVSFLPLSSNLSGSKSQVPFKLCHCWSGPIQKETVGLIKGKSCQDRRWGGKKKDTGRWNWTGLLEHLVAIDHILQVQQLHALKQYCAHINYLVTKKQTLLRGVKLICPRNSPAEGFQTPLPRDKELQVPTWHQYTQQE